jgi:hypothetical protein
MNLDDIPDQFKQLVELAGAAIEREIGQAKKIAAAASTETSAAQSALATLQAQCKQAQTRLELTTSEFNKVATLVGVGHDIDKARKELARVKAETAKAEKAVEARLKQCTEADSRLVGLNLEANRMIAIRTEGEAVMAHLRAQLAQVSIGR